MREALQTLVLAGCVAAGTTTAGTCQQGRGETKQPPANAANPGNDSPATNALDQDPQRHKAMVRLREDLGKIEANLKEAAHAFHGSLTFECQADTNMHNLALDFTGATNRTLQWFSLYDWQVVNRGEQSAVARAKARWDKPQGDSPDVPLSPLLFVPHLAEAELSLPTPAEYKGRPALRIRSRWRGNAATRAIYAATIPSTNHEQVVEALGSAAARKKNSPELFMVDATTLYDPAARQWLSSTLRFSYLDGRKIPDNKEPPPSPQGLPALQSFPVIEVLWILERCDSKDAPLPALDKRACELLKVDETGRPTDAGKEQTTAAQRKSNSGG